MHLLRRRHPEQLSILAFNPATTRADIGLEYIDAVTHSSKTDPIVVETQPTLGEYEVALRDGVSRFLEQTDGAHPKNVTVISGDRGVSDATAIIHNIRTTAHSFQLNTASEVDVAMAGVALAIIPAGNGNDRAKELITPKRLRSKTYPMPWNWPRRRELFPIKLTVGNPAGEQCTSLVLNYAGLGASALLIEYLAEHRDEWKQLSSAQRLRRELNLALKFAHESDIEIDDRHVSGLDLVCSTIMGKRIVTGTRPDKWQLKVIETPRQSRAGVARMAIKLAAGKPPEGRITTRGSSVISSGEAPFYVDGDYVGVLASGSTLQYESSRIWVPYESER